MSEFLRNLFGRGKGRSAQGPNEKELVDRIRSGDVEAFELLLDRHQERITRLVLSILKNPMDAEEVVQDVFLTVFEKIDRFREEASFSTWIHRIAVNAALMRRRKLKPGVDISLDDVLPAFDDQGQIAAQVHDWSQQIGDPVLQEEAIGVIQTAVDKLDEKYQSVFVLRDVQGFSTAETAAILDLGVPAVKSRLHRARLFLRGELAAYFDREDKQ
ncbi:MAG: sigma-70 family RNA polymerase sigma factor [Candidatus Latescibacteria bacterium]|nr:sigma-70 family RNA polymerase sigma factor [Candidatus Latescibacterota bacterium]